MVVVEDGPTRGGYKVSGIMCSYSSFDSKIVNKLEEEILFM